MPPQSACDRDVRGLAAVLLAAALGGQLLAQNSPQIPKPSSPGASIEAASKAAAHDPAPEKGTAGNRQRIGSVEIISDTQGTDFRPYLKGIAVTIRLKWYSLIPRDMRYGKGEPVVEFNILKDGKVSNMKLADSAGPELDRAAWDSIRMSNPMPALPEAFHGDHLTLRCHFLYNPTSSDLHYLHSETSTAPPH